ncbi:GDP-L-fucose synthase family protein [Marinifilum sp.]|uniref:GDP-L-fucose synthase family protein n=1 Tax=Marinifilum sp. TaxID=2033137 RepID=UPI003BABE520
MSFWHKKNILVTGGNGFLGKAVVRGLHLRGVEDKNIIIPNYPENDLRDYLTCLNFTKDIDIVIHLAAKVGGILFNQKHPASMIYDNIMMGFNLMEASRINGVKKLVNLGTTCSYPENAPIPFLEDSLWDGYPALVTAPYGLAKKMLSELSKGYKTEYGFESIFLLPVNLYGPEDNFIKENAHVIPALIQRFENAFSEGTPSVKVWGTGKATREFLYVDDAAEGILMATEYYNDTSPVNLGTGIETSIKDLVTIIADLIGYKGDIEWDLSKPDGTPRRCLDVSRAEKCFGFKANVSMLEGLQKTINWYRSALLSNVSS